MYWFVAAAYERRTLDDGRHHRFEDWDRFLTEHTTAVNLLDRLLPHCHTVITHDESDRMRGARTRGGSRPAPPERTRGGDFQLASSGDRELAVDRRDDAIVEQSITVEIAAPAERVWEVLTDVEQWSEWTETVTRVRRLDEGPLRSGSRAKINQPKIPEAEYVVTELDPGRSFTWVATGPGVTTTARHLVEALPGGGSRVTLAVEQSGWLGSVMGRFYRGLTDRYLANEAAGLKSRCEGEK